MKKNSLTKHNYDYLYYIKVKKLSSSYNIFLKYLGFYQFQNSMFFTLMK